MGLVQKSFSDIITFSRSSNATRVGPTGVLEYAPHNLALQSQTFDNASWSKLDATVTSNAIAAPDGTVTADKLIATTAVSTPHAVYQGAGSISANWTFSIYAKAGEYNRLGLAFSNTGYVFFNLTTGVQEGTVGLYITSYSITSVGNGWYRISFGSTVTASGTNIAVYLFNSTYTSGDPNFTGDGTSGVYIWGAQLAVGPYALDYTPTTSAAVYGPRFDYDGSGVTIVEPVSRNLVTYSEQFDNAAWTKTDATVTANTTTAPDGTVTADLMYPTTTGTYRATLQSNSGVSGQVYTASFYIKSAGFQWVALMTSAGGNIGVYFDVINGVKGTEANGTGTITSVGNGWFRCTITTTASSSTIYSGVTVVDANNSITATTSGTSGLYLWGAQLEVGSTATAYMVSGATNGFRAVPVVSGSATPRGLLVEEQRTNLVTYSEQFDNAAWAKTGSSVTANAVASPDGTVNADKLVEDTGNSTHQAAQSSVAAGTYTASVYAKAGERTKMEIATVPMDIGFDLSLGTILYGSGGSITSVGNGWYRCTITFTQAVSGNAIFRILNSAGNRSYTGDGTSGFYLWGAQLEAGSFATSYIPTPTNSAVTRTADVASVNTLSPWFNATEGTLFAEFDFIGLNPASPGINQGVACFTDGTATSNNFGLLGYGDGSASRSGFVFSGSSLVAFLGGPASSVNTTYKSALATKANDFRLVNSGGSVISDTSGAMPTGMNQLILGNLYTTTNLTYQNGHLRRVAFYPRRLTNAELQALTA